MKATQLNICTKSWCHFSRLIYKSHQAMKRLNKCTILGCWCWPPYSIHFLSFFCFFFFSFSFVVDKWLSFQLADNLGSVSPCNYFCINYNFIFRQRHSWHWLECLDINTETSLKRTKKELDIFQCDSSKIIYLFEKKKKKIFTVKYLGKHRVARKDRSFESLV